MADTPIRAYLQASLGENYTLGRELGGGGMATVFVAEETTLGRKIVVKVLPPEMAAELSLARFHREITLAARLQHPHIVPLLSAGETQGLPYYTMPYVDGETLRERITRLGEMPIAEAVRLLREIATAIAYAHEAGIVHRDIKPENILLSGDVALVTDFGVAKAVLGSGGERLTTAGIAVGTPAYMSPEQVGADPDVDHRADIYALGVVAYEMLTGHTPFVGRNVQALLAAHVVTEPEPIVKRRAALPAALATLVMQCLAKRPADRPQHANDIVRTLDSVTMSGPAISVPRRAGVPRGAWIGAASVVIAAAAAVWFLTQRNKTPAATTASSKILIAPFENLTGDPRLDNIGRIAADRLTQIVAQGARIDVVPAATVLMSLRDTTGGTAERIRRLTSAMHVGLLASGTIVKRGDSLTLQMQVTDLRTGKVVIALEPTRGTASDPITALDALGDRLLGALGGREVTLIPNNIRAPTNAAYQEFSKGFERFAMYGDNLGARPYFERAIALDSTYVRAYQLLARQYLNAGEFARADSMVRRIDRLPQGLTVVERIGQDYSKAELSGDIAGLLRTQQALVAIDSSSVSLYLLGEAATGLLRPDLAIPALELAAVPYAALSERAYRGLLIYLTEAYHEGGKHDREVQSLTEQRAVFGDITFWRGRQLRAYAAVARSAAALALVDTMLRAATDSSGTLLGHIVTAAAEFRAHGDPRTAAQLSSKARGWIEAHPERAPTPSRLLQEGLVLAANGMNDSAITRFAIVARTSNRMDAAGYHAIALVARGDRDRARSIADSLGAFDRPWMFGTNTFWRAAILGALGEREVAVEQLRKAHLEGVWMQTWHYTPSLDALHGFGPFETLVRPTR